MIKRLRKLGKSRGLVLDKTLLELLGLEPRGLVQLTLTNGSLIVTPVNPNPVSKKRFDECLDKVMTERADMLRQLPGD
jgi:antitoxin component of MazEF toxin-antitoxin module